MNLIHRPFKNYFFASFAFLNAILRPIDLIEKRCLKGHSLLLNWNECPDCKWIDGAKKAALKHKKSQIKSLLFCFQGKNKYELLELTADQETLGMEVQNNKVLTSEKIDFLKKYKILLSQPPVLFSETSHPFEINGMDSWKENLFDYDEIKIFENSFLVLEI